MSARARGWELPERQATPEPALLDRRSFIGIAASGAVATLAYPVLAALPGIAPKHGEPRRLAHRHASHLVVDRVTDEHVAARFNHFVELTPNRDAHRFVDDRPLDQWLLRIDGLVEKPRVLDLDDLRRIAPEEERVYRHRCVEGWAAAVPWRGIPLAAIVRAARPLGSARYLRFTSAPQAAKARGDGRPGVYTEGLTIAEAVNELAFCANGIYGHDLPPQHGAPVRLAAPWKYAFKSIKAVARIEFLAAKPTTFWNSVAPQEYPFHGNVDPSTPHPRWSQASEKMLGSGEVRATLPFNGYGEWVAHLYV